MTENKVPHHFFTCACGQGESPVAARYQALAEAGLADQVLLNVQGFLPPGSLLQPPGPLPTNSEQRLFMAHVESAVGGEVISAAVAVAYPEDSRHGAPVIPVASTGHKEDIEHVVYRETLGKCRNYHEGDGDLVLRQK